MEYILVEEYAEMTKIDKICKFSVRFYAFYGTLI